MPLVVLVPLYIGLLAAPLALAWGMGLPARGWRDELASGLALVAFAILLAEFALSGRFRIISRRMGSDVTMRFHQLIARAALVFALLHPFLYAAPFAAARPWDPDRSDTLLYRIDYLATGTLAWILLLPFVLIAIGRERMPWSYETWRALHGAGAVAIVGLTGYHALIGGRYSTEPPLAWLWLALIALALLSLVHVYVVKPLMQLRRRYRVRSVRKVAERTWEVAIVPERGAALRFEAGQFVWLNIGHSPFSLAENPFSIASAPDRRDRLEFLIKEAGDFTASLGDVAAGTPAYVDGPHGHLTLHGHEGGRRAAGIALIAGGVGLAPLISILRDLRHAGDARPLALVYGNRAASQIAYGEELAAAEVDLDLRVVHVLSEPPQGWTGATGFIDMAALRTACRGAPPADWLYVLCGPAPMLTAVSALLRAAGVPRRQIVSERFSYD